MLKDSLDNDGLNNCRNAGLALVCVNGRFPARRVPMAFAVGSLFNAWEGFVSLAESHLNLSEISD
jgi:hypothetical protein